MDIAIDKVIDIAIDMVKGMVIQPATIKMVLGTCYQEQVTLTKPGTTLESRDIELSHLSGSIEALASQQEKEREFRTTQPSVQPVNFKVLVFSSGANPNFQCEFCI